MSYLIIVLEVLLNIKMLDYVLEIKRDAKKNNNKYFKVN